MDLMDRSEGKIDPTFFSTCRLCVSKPGSYQILPQIQKQIKEFFDISVHAYDGLPQLLCEECRSVITYIHATRTTFQTKQKELISRNRVLNTSEDVEGNAKYPEDEVVNKEPLKNTDFIRSPKREQKSFETDITYTIEDDDDIPKMDSGKSPRNEVVSSTVKSMSEESLTADSDTSTDILIVDDDNSIQNMDGVKSLRIDRKSTGIKTVQNLDPMKLTSNELQSIDTDTSIDPICIVEGDSLQNVDRVQSPSDDTKSTDQIIENTETSTDCTFMMEDDDSLQNTKSKPTGSVIEYDNSNQNVVNLNSPTNESKSSNAKCSVEDDKNKISTSSSHDSANSISLPKKYKMKWQKLYTCKFCMQTFSRRYKVGPHLETHYKLIKSQEVHKIKHAYVPMVRIGGPRRRNSNCSETSVYLMHGFRVNNIFDNYFSSSHSNDKTSTDEKYNKREKKYSRIKRISSSSSEHEIVMDGPAAKRVNIDQKPSVDNSHGATTPKYYSEIDAAVKQSIKRMNRPSSNSNSSDIETFKNDSAPQSKHKFTSEMDKNIKNSIKRKLSSSGDIEIVTINPVAKRIHTEKTQQTLLKPTPLDKFQSQVKCNTVKIRQNSHNAGLDENCLDTPHKTSKHSESKIRSRGNSQDTPHPKAKHNPEVFKKLILDGKQQCNSKKHTESNVKSAEIAQDLQSRRKSNPEINKKSDTPAPKLRLDDNWLKIPESETKLVTETKKTVKPSASKTKSDLQVDKNETIKHTEHSTSRKLNSGKLIDAAQSKDKASAEINKESENSTLKKLSSKKFLVVAQSKERSNPEINKKTEPFLSKRISSEKSLDTPQSKDKSNPEFKKEAQQSRSKRRHSEKSRDAPESKDISEIDKKVEQFTLKIRPENSQAVQQSKDISNPEINIVTEQSPLKRRPSEKPLDVQSMDTSNSEIKKKSVQTKLKRKTSENSLDSPQSNQTADPEINKMAEQTTLERRTPEESLNLPQTKNVSNPEISKKAEQSTCRTKNRPVEKSQDVLQSKDRSNSEIIKKAEKSPLKKRFFEKLQQSIDKSIPEINKKADQPTSKIKTSGKSLNLSRSKDTSTSENNRKTKHSVTNKSSEESLDKAQVKYKSNTEINKKAEQPTLKRSPEKSLDVAYISYPEIKVENCTSYNECIDRSTDTVYIEATPDEEHIKLEIQNTQNMTLTKVNSPSKNTEHFALNIKIEDSEDTTPLESTSNLNLRCADQTNTESSPTMNKDAEDSVLKLKTEVPDEAAELEIINDPEINKEVKRSLDITQLSDEIYKMTKHSKVDESLVEPLNEGMNEIREPVINLQSQSNKVVTKTSPKNNSSFKMLPQEKLKVVSVIRDTFQRYSEDSRERSNELLKDATLIYILEKGPIDIEWRNSNSRNSYRIEAVQGESKDPNRGFKNYERFRLPFRDIAKSLRKREQETSTSAVPQSVEEHTITALDMPIIVSANPLTLPPPEIISFGYSQPRTQQNPPEGTPQSTTTVLPEIISTVYSQPQTQQNPPEETPQNVIQISIAESLNQGIMTVDIVNKHLPVGRGRVPQLLANMSLLQPSRPVIKCKPASALLSSPKEPWKQSIKPFDRIVAELRDIGLTLHEDISLPDFRALTRYDADIGWQKLKVSLYVSENRYNFFCIQVTDNRGRLAIREESAGNQHQILESLQTQDIRKTIEKNAEALSIQVLYETARFMSTVTKIFQKPNSVTQYSQLPVTLSIPSPETSNLPEYIDHMNLYGNDYIKN